MDILWAWLEVGTNKKVEMTLSASEWIKQGLLRLIYIFSPSSI